MMFEEILVFCIVLILTGVNGSLYQGSPLDILCPSECLTLICTDNDGPLIEWRITTPDGAQASLFLSNFVDRVQHREFKFTTLRAELIFENTSFYISSLTIAAYLSSTIQCNNNEFVYSFENNSPTQVFLQRNPDDYHYRTSGYNITWKPHFQINYTVTVSSPNNTLISRSISAHDRNKPLFLDLTDNSLHNITISFEKCPIERASIFISECFFNISDDYSMLQINGMLNNTWSAWIIYNECTHNLVCMNGTWKSNENMTCKHQTNNVTKGQPINTDVSMHSLASTKVMNTVQSKSSPADNSSSQILSDSTLILASTLGSTGIFGLTTMFVVTAIAIVKKFCLRKFRKISLGTEARARAHNMEQSSVLQLEPTYQQLSNRHLTKQMKIHTNEAESATGDYSTIHKKYSSSQYSELSNKLKLQTGQAMYDEVRTTQPNFSTNEKGFFGDEQFKFKQQLIDENDSMDLCDDRSMPNMGEMQAEYSNVCLMEHPKDKEFNLDSLLIQLRPISDKFQLFGSVAGIPPDKLDHISSCCTTTYDGLLEVCELWLNKRQHENSPPTWHVVAEMLSLIGDYKMANDILQVYVTGKLPIEVDMKSLKYSQDLREFSPSPPPIPPQDEKVLEGLEIRKVAAGPEQRHISYQRPLKMLGTENASLSKQLHVEHAQVTATIIDSGKMNSHLYVNKDCWNVPQVPPKTQLMQTSHSSSEKP